MKDIALRNLYTDRLELRIPTMKEQKRLWEILCIEDVNKYYFPTPDRIFNKHNLSQDNLDDLKAARKIFLEQLNDWERQKPFYEKKIEKINNGDDSQKFTWSIFLKGTDTVIGQITCQPKNEDTPYIRDMGWYIDPEYQHRGYCTEAGKAMLDYMFNEVEIDSIETGVAAINPNSWRIIEKYGFKYTGDTKITYYDDTGIVNLKEYYATKDMFNASISEK